MARVERTNLTNRLSASLGRQQGGSLTSVTAAGRGLDALARAGQDVGEVAGDIAVSFAKREAERKYLDAELNYQRFKSDFLYGEKGVMHREGPQAEGLTDEVGRGLNEYLQSQSTEIDNGVVREQFRNYVQSDLVDTTNLAAKHEAEKLARVRETNAATSLELTIRNAVVHDPSKFLPTALGGSDAVLNDLVLTTEDRIRTANPDIGEVAVKELARQTLAEGANQAIYSLMSNGAHNVRAARAIQRQWQDQWDPQTRVAAEKRVVDELGFTQMRTIVNEAAIQLGGSGFTDKQIVDASTKKYESWFKENFGKDASSEHIDEVGRKARDFNTLVKDHVAQQRNQRQDSILVTFMKATGSGSPDNIVSTYDKLREKALQSNDPDLVASLDTLMGNWRTNKEIYPSKPTLEGLRAKVEGGRGKTRVEALLMAAHLPKADHDQYVTEALGGDTHLPPKEELRDAINNARNRLTGKGPYPTTAKGDEDGDYLSKFAAVENLSKALFKRESRLPTPEEIDDFAMSVHFSLNDPYKVDSGLSGNLGDFLNAPLLEGRNLRPSEPRDKFILDSALLAAQRDPRAAKIVIESLGLSTRPENLKSVDLENNPELAAKLVELSIISNPPVVDASGNLGTRTRLVRKTKGLTNE